MTASREEKIEMLKGLNWDYNADPEKMLAVVEGKSAKEGVFDRQKLFVRSLERLPWHRVLLLWGLEAADNLYTEDASRRIWPAELRRRYDFVFGTLRKKPVSASGWDPQQRREMQHTILSDRWYRAQQN